LGTVGMRRFSAIANSVLQTTKRRRARIPNSNRYLDENYYREAADYYQTYDPGDWLPTLTITVTMFLYKPWAIITCLVVLCALLVQLEPTPYITHLFSLPVTAHEVLGVLLGLMVVFRTEISYGRWWEARGCWASIIDNCHGLAAVCAPCLADVASRRALLCQLMTLCIVTKNWLREEPTKAGEVGELLEHRQVAQYEEAPCPPFAVVDHIARTVRSSTTSMHAGSAKASTFCSTAAAHCEKLCESVTACGRIKNTPMPLAYITALRTSLVIWLVTLPLSIVGEYGWISTAAVSLLAFLFLYMEKMAVEIEQPFGTDPNDLPLELYILKLEKTFLGMLPNLRTAANDAPNIGGRLTAAAPSGAPVEPNVRFC